MPIGSRRKRDEEEYVFIDGKAMRSDEAVRIKVDTPPRGPIVGGDVGAPVPGSEEARKPRAAGSGRWSASRAFDELRDSDAFAVNDQPTPAAGRASALQAESKRETRRRIVGPLVALVVMFLVSLCLSSYNIGEFYSPGTVAQALARRFALFVSQTFSPDTYSPTLVNEANAEIPGYGDICRRFDITIVTLVCGFLLSVSGMLYQNVFKNPIAAPSMLGVSAGVRIGTIALVVTYGTAALSMSNMRYVYCYIGGIVILLGVVGFSKLLAGRGRSINVADMLIVGSVFSQVLQTVSMYFLTLVMSDDDYEVFYELTSGMRTDTDPLAFVFLAIVILVAIVPVFLMRFRLNVVSFDDEDMRVMGVSPTRLRVFALVMGTLMILAAQIHVGVISMVALVVPFLTRYVTGSEFGSQLAGNMILGPLLLLLCRFICGIIPFVSGGLSLEMIVGFVALPVYVWMMAMGQKGWE